MALWDVCMLMHFSQGIIELKGSWIVISNFRLRDNGHILEIGVYKLYKASDIIDVSIIVNRDLLNVLGGVRECN